LRYGALLQIEPQQLRKATAITFDLTAPDLFNHVVRDRFLDWISSWILGSLAPKGWRAPQLSFKPAS
jgi:hypothetical protein